VSATYSMLYQAARLKANGAGFSTAVLLVAEEWCEPATVVFQELSFWWESLPPRKELQWIHDLVQAGLISPFDVDEYFYACIFQRQLALAALN
jgi:hypothetical protein